MENSPKIGEVVEAGTTEFIAQSYELHQAPPFGSFVRTSDGALDIYGVVHLAKTTGIDPGRRPLARGKDEESEEDIFRNNPELSELLRTEFTAATIGFRGSGAVLQYLPPRPPRIHGFVYECSPGEVVAFTDRLDFLQTIATSGIRGPVDELIAACIRSAAEARGGDRAFLIRAGKELAMLLGSEVGRLNGILRRIRG
ncbi:MAG: hypothetical protein M1358_21015 [Chloroflexi bacterium]|nr:hypothetical protein [Chloroflexota bacterium]